MTISIFQLSYYLIRSFLFKFFTCLFLSVSSSNIFLRSMPLSFTFNCKVRSQILMRAQRSLCQMRENNELPIVETNNGIRKIPSSPYSRCTPTNHRNGKSTHHQPINLQIKTTFVAPAPIKAKLIIVPNTSIHIHNPSSCKGIKASLIVLWSEMNIERTAWGNRITIILKTITPAVPILATSQPHFLASLGSFRPKA